MIMPQPVCRPVATMLCAGLLGLFALAHTGIADARNAQESGPSQMTGALVPGPDTGVTGPHEFAGQTYADLVDLAIASPVVARATVHRQSTLKIEESPGLAPGNVRLYIEADTAALLVGPQLGESLRFLADVPLDARGKVPKLTKSQVLLFARAVPDKPGELQLTAADTMLAWSPGLDEQVRAILTELVSPDAPPPITGVREALHVPGNLTGEGETQAFLSTSTGAPVSISVVRRPGEPTRWGVSFNEIVDQAAGPPRPRTLAWYRLACSLPPALPAQAAISATATDKRLAAEDYALVVRELGPCLRNRARP